MKVAVVGLGRVGLPLSLFFEEQGHKVIGIDRDPQLIKKLERKEMPFVEKGCQELLEKSDLKLTQDWTVLSEVDSIVITVGTPLMPHIETDLQFVRSVFDSMIPQLRKGHNIILRSTVAPGTTEFLGKYLELKSGLKIGRDVALSFCPERLAENKALMELEELPQIIGAKDQMSSDAAEEVFKPFGVKIFHTNYVSAELVKLFNNCSRYIDFAVANYFTVLANSFGQNIFELIKMANEDYPRGYIHSPGLTAGSCLRKDFGFINERSFSSDLFLSAWKVNEHIPFHLVDSIKGEFDFFGKNVAVLGYTMKQDADDYRDSLVPKLIRYIDREVPAQIRLHEPNVMDDHIEGHRNFNKEDALREADVIFLAVNHSAFSKEGYLDAAPKGCWVVDLWNVTGRGEFKFRL